MMTTREFYQPMLLAVMTLMSLMPVDPPAVGVLRIGLTQSMLPPEEEKKFDVMATNFKEVILAQTGLKGDPVAATSAENLRQQLAEGMIQLGAFQGFEFAWLKHKHPDLEALLLASPTADALYEVIVVAKDSPAKTMADCRGMKLALAKSAREDTRHFLAHRCLQLGSNMKEMFPEPNSTKSAEEALDNVVDGVAKVAAVDRNVWKMLERRKPGRAAKLQVIETSEPFVPPVLAYCKGKLDAAVVQKLRDGMTTAHTTPKGNHFMSQLKIVKFEAVPADFDKRLAESMKAYPPAE
jgi:ABC-type phosphate/phosphonate transport system substrate-binding protein